MNISEKKEQEKIKIVEKRKELVFTILSGIFLGTLGMLNILGISRFIDLSFTIFSFKIPMVVAIGVLPYPVTFICTDLISELYGRKKANQLVWVGFLVNAWIIFIIWLGSILPGFEQIDAQTGEIIKDSAGRLPIFFEMKNLAFGAVAASMIAYLTAQFCDVYLFHFWKDLTKGKHLWLRNNASTFVSQMVDTVSVILITHYFVGGLPISEETPVYKQLLTFIFSGYAFKVIVAFFDTLPLYILVAKLNSYFNPENIKLDNNK